MKKALLKIKKGFLKLASAIKGEPSILAMPLMIIFGFSGLGFYAASVKTKESALESFKKSDEYKIYRMAEAENLDDLEEKYILTPKEKYLKGEISAEELLKNEQKYNDEISKSEENGLKIYANDETKNNMKKSKAFENTSLPLLASSFLLMLAGLALDSMASDSFILDNKIDQIDDKLREIDKEKISNKISKLQKKT